MTEREAWDLRGAVQSCRLQRSWYTRNCGADACETEERGDTTALEFRADGSVARRWHHNPDGSEWTEIHEFDDGGRLTGVRIENGTRIAHRNSYEYDAAGRLTSVIARPNGSGERITESYEYDEAGRKRKTFYADVATQRPDTQYVWSVEGTDSGYSAPGAATLVTVYNEREQPSELLFYDGSGDLLSRIGFSYDGAGNLIEEAQTRTMQPDMPTTLNAAQLQAARDLLSDLRRTHRYDEHGRRIESVLRMGSLGGDRKTMTYNDRGDLVEEIAEDEAREYSVDNEGRLADVPGTDTANRSESRSRYEYDGRGNWTIKTVESRGGSEKEFTLSSVEQRTVGYFD